MAKPFFSGYSGTTSSASSGSNSKSASVGGNGSGKSSYFKGYTGASYDPNYVDPSKLAAAPKPSSPHGLLQQAIKFVGDNFVKPVVDSGKSIYHEGHAATMAIGSMVEGHHGAQLATDKANVKAEFNRGNVGKAAPELTSGNINKDTGKVTGAAPITAKTVRKATGAAAEDAINVGGIVPAGKAVKAGEVAVQGAKNAGESALKAAGKEATKQAAVGAGYGAAYGGATVAQKDKVTPGDVGKAVGGGAAGGALIGGALGGIGTLLARGAKPLVSKASEKINQVVDSARINKTPSSVIEHLPTVAAGDTSQPVLNQKFVQAKYGELKQAVQEASKGMSDRDINLLQTIETTSKSAAHAKAKVERIAKTADNPQQFRDVVDKMRNAYDVRRNGDVHLGRDVGFIHNYLPHLYDTTDKGTADALEKLQLRANTKPGYTNERIIPTYAHAEKLAASGEFPQLKRANANVLEDFYQSMDRAGNDHGVQALKAGIEQAHPGVQVGVGKIGFDPKSGESYHQLQLSGAGSLSLPKDLAAEYNKRAPSTPSTGVVGAYDKGNAIAKTSILGGGTFHMLTTFGTMTGRQIASGDLIKHPILNLKIIAGTFNKGAHSANMQRFAENGTLDKARLSGVTLGANDIRGDVGGHGGVPIIKQIHDAVFQRQIPEAKLTIFEQATKGLDASNPEHLAYMRKVASAVNNLGGINRAVAGLTPKQAKQMARILLATDFTEGKLRTIGAAITRWGSIDGKIARQMVVGKSVLFALPGLAALTAAGKIDWSNADDVAKNVGNQFLDPSIGLGTKSAGTKSNPDGTPQAVHFPSTFVSEIGKIIAPALDPLSPDKLSGVKDYLTNRVAALPAVTSRLVQNKDFYGNPIYGNDKNGNPLGAGKTALNIASQVLPIPAVQGIKQGSGQQGIRDTILNTAGFRVSNDKTSLESGHSRAITDLYNVYNAQSTAKSKVSKQISDLIATGNVNQAHRLAQQWNQSIQNNIAPVLSKHAGSYNAPAWQDKFKTLEIKTSSRADITRLKNAKANAALLK